MESDRSAGNWRPALGTALFLCAALCSCGDPTAPAEELLAPPGPAASVRAAPTALSPPFSPEIHDYVVRCGAGLNTVQLGVVAPEGGTARVLTPGPSAAAASQIVTLLLTEDQAAVIEAWDRSGVRQEYWVRCLPRDFPDLIVSAHPSLSRPAPGYYLLGNAVVGKGKGAYAMILDGHGTPVWYRRVPPGAVAIAIPGKDRVAYSPVLGPGYGTDPAGQLRIRYLEIGQTESVRATGGPTDMHELLQLKNGNRALLSYRPRSGIDLTGSNDHGASATIADCLIEEIAPDGAVVWRWRASDHVDPVREPTLTLVNQIDGQRIVDVYHCNALEETPEGDLLLSMRHTDAIYAIDRESSAIRWKLGGTPYTKDDAKILALRGDPQGAFYRQHDVRLLPGGDLSLFDNHGADADAGPARGVIYALDLAAGEARFLTHFPGATKSAAMGSFRYQPDGTAVVGWGAPTEGDNIVFTEFDAAGRRLLDVSFGPGDLSYRVIKAPPDLLTLDFMRRDVTR